MQSRVITLSHGILAVLCPQSFSALQEETTGFFFYDGMHNNLIGSRL